MREVLLSGTADVEGRTKHPAEGFFPLLDTERIEKEGFFGPNHSGN